MVGQSTRSASTNSEPSVTPTMDSPLSASQLLFHTLNLLNILTSGLSTYSSLANLTHDATSKNLPTYHYVTHLTGQAATLHDCSRKLAGAIDALTTKAEHRIMMLQGGEPYLCLLKAGFLVPKIVAEVVEWRECKTGDDGGVVVVVEAQEVDAIARAAWAVMVLQNGDDRSGEPGWLECWGLVRGYSACGKSVIGF